MLDRGIPQGFGYGGNAPAAVRQQDGCGGHAGLRLFLEKGFAVMLLQKPFRLPGSQPQLDGSFQDVTPMVTIALNDGDLIDVGEGTTIEFRVR